jgi:hypothetical protein
VDAEAQPVARRVGGTPVSPITEPNSLGRQIRWEIGELNRVTGLAAADVSSLPLNHHQNEILLHAKGRGERGGYDLLNVPRYVC